MKAVAVQEKIYSARSVPEFIEIVRSVGRAWKQHYLTNDNDIWFRGVSDSRHQLLPGAYRSDSDHLSMFNEFYARGHSLLMPKPESELDWYFAAQHYGIPTRLLDWSDSPLVALYFAVRAVTDGQTPSIWMMDACVLNEISYGTNEVLIPRASSDGFCAQWSPQVVGSGRGSPKVFSYDGRGDFSNEKPIALLPPRSTNRIIAQRGMFTLHGFSPIPIEQVFSESAYPQFLTRIDIPDVQRCLEDLQMLGYDNFYIFPEAASLAEVVKERYQVAASRVGSDGLESTKVSRRGATTQGAGRMGRVHQKGKNLSPTKKTQQGGGLKVQSNKGATRTRK